MSKENGEVEKKVTCSAEDCDNFLNYEKHFNVPLSDDLRKAIENFRNDPTYDNQTELKLEACKWILECDHESFKDSLWDTPKKTAEQEVYNLQFDKDIKDALSEDDDEDKSDN